MSENEKYDVIIGLEIHVQTNTKSKMFCKCPTGYFQKEPNTHVCPVCLGLPGALPIPNKRAIELCILMGIATHCNIDNEIYFDRKHYFYPDLPKGYQISQYKRAICSNGYIDLSNGNKVEIERIHQEEDVAKSTHHSENGKEYTLIDYNKSGVPLIEIVTKPCIKSASDAKEFASKVRQIARYLGISDADMEKGQMRCEPNISVQEKGKWELKDGKILPIGDYKLNSKVEVKNIGSISAVEKSIEYEVKRLTEEIENGKEIIQQTRGWNAEKGITEFQRSKETADDYRYMPEPDIPVIEVSNEDLERISKEIIELPDEKVKRYMRNWGVSKYAAEVISSTKENARYFESLQEELNKTLDEKESAIEASNWLMGTVYSIANASGKDVSEMNIDLGDLALLILSFKEGVFTKNKAEELLKECIEMDKDISDEINKLKEEKESNSGNLVDIVKGVINSNEKAVEDYKNGKDASIGFLVGKVMQETKGTANPNDVRNILVEELKK
ncbi:Asp-tRNA(Asn)/Glu-tRNA(Gln) amidotransferase subunit GatB [Candidatus Microgenomates bacterium]|nr:Asp-tRNA(Asn)/Glu-tRNA(Gln) amidotransferase subunit GatB [Candidatus Microgenomates bacterium]